MHEHPREFLELTILMTITRGFSSSSPRSTGKSSLQRLFSSLIKKTRQHSRLSIRVRSQHRVTNIPKGNCFFFSFNRWSISQHSWDSLEHRVYRKSFGKSLLYKPLRVQLFEIFWILSAADARTNFQRVPPPLLALTPFFFSPLLSQTQCLGNSCGLNLCGTCAARLVYYTMKRAYSLDPFSLAALPSK